MRMYLYSVYLCVYLYLYLLLLLERKKELLEFFVFGYRHWFNAPPHSKWHFKNLLKKKQKTRQTARPGHCRTFPSPSLFLFLGACCAHLLARPDCIQCLCLMCVWGKVDSIQIQLQLQLRRYSYRYQRELYTDTSRVPASLSGMLSAQTHSKSFRFPWKCFKSSMKNIYIVYTIHLFCSSLFRSLSYSLSILF